MSRYVKIPLEILLAALENAAHEGIEVGKKGTAGDYTEAGIAFHAYNDHQSEIEIIEEET